MTDDSHHRAVRTVAAEPTLAKRATSANQINLANHSFADPPGRIAFHYFPNKLVPRDAAKAGIAFQNLAVRSADSRQPYANQCFARRHARSRNVLNRKLTIEDKSFHRHRTIVERFGSVDVLRTLDVKEKGGLFGRPVCKLRTASHADAIHVNRIARDFAGNGNVMSFVTFECICVVHI